MRTTVPPEATNQTLPHNDRLTKALDDGRISFNVVNGRAYIAPAELAKIAK